MSITLTIPRKLHEKLMERGIDIESLIIDTLISHANLDPEDEAEIHLELAEKFLEEGKGFIDKDPVQASEKLYKAAEESVKAAAYYLGLNDIINKVRDRGRWTVTELEKTVKAASKILGEDFYIGWDRANYLHVWGFHEAKLDGDDVKERLPFIERMVALVKQMIAKHG